MGSPRAKTRCSGDCLADDDEAGDVTEEHDDDEGGKSIAEDEDEAGGSGGTDDDDGDDDDPSRSPMAMVRAEAGCGPRSGADQLASC